MKTVRIITLYGLNNYGNRLQNYAVHQVIKDMGFWAKSFAVRMDNRLTYRPINKKEEIAIEIHRLTYYKYYNNPAHLAIYHWKRHFAHL